MCLAKPRNLEKITASFFHRRTDPFSDDLLPTEVPALLTGLPGEDIMSDDEM